MSDAASMIGAGVAIFTPVGGAIAFVWNKIEKRFGEIEAELKLCQAREDLGERRRAIQYTIIELMRQELNRLSPAGSWAMGRVEDLLTELKATPKEPPK